MAWLIRKKATLLGRVARNERILSELPSYIQAMRAEIAALDLVIPLHEVKVDPNAIKAKRTKSKPALPYGVVTRGIYECLRLANDEPITSLEIAIHIAKAQGIDIRKSARIRIAVRDRLNTLARENKVTRHHSVTSNDFGIWSLPKDGGFSD